MIKFSILQNIFLLRNLSLFPFYYLLKYIFNIKHLIACGSLFKIIFPFTATRVPSRIILQNRFTGCILLEYSVHFRSFAAWLCGLDRCLWRQGCEFEPLDGYICCVCGKHTYTNVICLWINALCQLYR